MVAFSGDWNLWVSALTASTRIAEPVDHLTWTIPVAINFGLTIDLKKGHKKRICSRSIRFHKPTNTRQE
jgi:hypothetical protein